jgi:hypothetical protein
MWFRVRKIQALQQDFLLYNERHGNGFAFSCALDMPLSLFGDV